MARGEGRRRGDGRLRLATEMSEATADSGIRFHAAGLTAVLERWEPWRASHGPCFSAPRLSGLRHAPVDCHCSGGNVPVVAPGPRLLHTWMFVGCFSAAQLHPQASRARRMIAMTSAPSTASLPLMCQSRQCVNTNPDFHFFVIS